MQDKKMTLDSGRAYRPVLDGMLGMAVGDALGVPYEFRSRAQMDDEPAVDMIGYGTYCQPEGSWSDDTSMALCTADSLIRGFDPEDMMKKFSAWKQYGEYTATGVRFDIGMSCQRAIERFEMGLDVDECGDAGEYGNGNGALMRIFPVAMMQCLLDPQGNGDAGAFLYPVHRASAITHAHERGLICCGIYTMILQAWMNRTAGESLLAAASRGYLRAQRAYLDMGGRFEQEFSAEGRFVHPEVLVTYARDEIRSSGYVLDTLHAALWCVLTTESYEECVLRAVNLGEDTDTTAAVAGSLAGVLYGRERIPAHWLDRLKNPELIFKICTKLESKLLA